MSTPPVPFSEFEFSFDSTLSGILPPPPFQLPRAGDLFSPSETTDLLGFLDNFDLEFDARPSVFDQPYPISPIRSSSNSLFPPPFPSSSSVPGITRDHVNDGLPVISEVGIIDNPRPLEPSSYTIETLPFIQQETQSPPKATNGIKPLSTPQKRLNHIMSEQKRRNAIRGGYAQLISLLAPSGAPGIDMPARGRPKGSGRRGKGKSQGKSGVLFSAVEYCRWLEDEREALKQEIFRLEMVAHSHH